MFLLAHPSYDTEVKISVKMENFMRILCAYAILGMIDKH